jgi:hypothetical protein
MHVPSGFGRETDVALLAGLAEPVETDPVLLDGRRPAYLVTHGEADLYAVPRGFHRPLSTGTFLARIEPGTVLPSSTVLGAWQLLLASLPGTRVRPLCARRLRRLGFGGPADADTSADPMVPPPRAVPVLMAALARGVDAGLLAVADALRAGAPPAHCLPLGDTQLLSLAAGSALSGHAGDGLVTWLRVAGGHIRRNGEDAAVFGGPEPALLAGRDWIVADGPCTVEATDTTDLLVAGQLPAAIDHHTVLTLRTIERLLAGGELAGSPPAWPPPNCPRCGWQ